MDVMRHVRANLKLDRYSLDYVSFAIMKENKKDLDPQDLFRAIASRDPDRLHARARRMNVEAYLDLRGGGARRHEHK